MKKLFTILLLAVAFTSCEKEDMPITFDQLPATAQSFIEQHFSKSDIIAIESDKELFDSEYKVLLKNGCTVEFSKSGNWESVDCSSSSVPTAIIPEKISTYVTTTYPEYLVTEIEKSNTGFDVELNNNLELDFDSTGNFIRIDI